LPGSQSPAIVQSYPITRPEVRQREASPIFPWGVEISGRVIIVRQGPHEPMDFDPWRWVALPVWGIVLLVAPVAIAILVWQTFGFLPALGAAVIALIVLRFIFSDRLLQTWHLTSALNGRHIVEPMPVLMARVRRSDEREIQLRLKGYLRGGTLMEGDRVRATGNLRRGVLNVQSIICERTGASIAPRQPNARTLAIAGVCVLMATIVWLVLAGIPWVTGQADVISASLRQTAFPDNVQLQLP